MFNETISQPNNVYKRRAAITDALVASLEVFCSHVETTFNEVMSNGLRPIAEAMEVDHIIVYRYVEIDGEKQLKQQHRWKTEKVEITDENVDLLPNNKIINGWLEILMQGLYVNQRICDMTKDEKSYMDIFGIKSVLIIPFFTHGEFWGSVVFQDHVRERLFEEDCVDLMLSAARICVNAIIRANMTKGVEETLEMLRHNREMKEVLNKTAITFLSQRKKPFAEMMEAGIGRIVDKVNIDTLSVWRNFAKEEGLNMAQIYRWDRDLGGSTTPADLFSDITYAKYAPSWERLFAYGGTINGPVRLMRERETAMILKEIGIVSVFTMPVFIDNSLWGVVLYGDRENECHYDEDSAELMRSAAFLFANAVMHKEMEQTVAEVEGRIKLMLDTSPLCCQLWDSNFNIIECNEAAVKLYGLQNKQEYMDRFFELSPEYQPDGQQSREKAMLCLKRAFAEGRCSFDWMHQMPDGTFMPAEVTIVRVVYKDDYLLAAYTRDLREFEKMENRILRLETEADKIYYDALTGIYNRRFFDENLERIVKMLSRSGGTLSLMMIDIDFFKRYNDAYGHSVGDECLKTVASALARGITRADDFVARYGGEEFAVVLPNAGEGGACMIAKKILKMIRDCDIPHEDSDVAGYVTVSIGLVTGSVNHVQNSEDYVRWADEMLYKSKRDGRNKYTFKNF